ncbi:LLM class flavin-dependent oxidoreductase [Streptomyces sp. NPDC000133]|uniref:LLM class flavin-dependent oxidoreductase n=1 Tax=Streptomyces sp. NPDC000133 TaxID=3364535 RepID=UPI0036A082EE
MTDYGHDLLFGTVLMPSAGRPGEVVELARVAERGGLDLVSVPDHPYQPGLLDAWTTLAVVAAATTRVRVFPNVANLPLRPPAVLARSAASLDLLSGGRVEIGLGAGAYWDNIAAEGGPRRSPGEALQATLEAIDVMRALWTSGRGVRLDGKHYGLYGAAPGPLPAHDISLWIGAVGPRMLRLIGCTGDGWLPSVPHVPPGQLAAGHRIVDEAAEEAGRAPAAVRRLYNLSPGGFPQGAPRDWAEQLAELTLEHGTSTFLLPAHSPDQLLMFGEEVAPAVRAMVGRNGHAAVGRAHRDRRGPTGVRAGTGAGRNGPRRPPLTGGRGPAPSSYGPRPTPACATALNRCGTSPHAPSGPRRTRSAATPTRSRARPAISSPPTISSGRTWRSCGRSWTRCWGRHCRRARPVLSSRS